MFKGCYESGCLLKRYIERVCHRVCHIIGCLKDVSCHGVCECYLTSHPWEHKTSPAPHLDWF